MGVNKFQANVIDAAFCFSRCATGQIIEGDRQTYCHNPEASGGNHQVSLIGNENIKWEFK